MIREQVREAYPGLAAGIEGGSREYMYANKRGICIGIGYVLPNMGSALDLPFVHKKDGRKQAEKEEIMFDWKSVKLNQRLGKGTQHITKLKINKPTILELALRRMEVRANELKLQVEFQEYPADAQLAALAIPEDVFASNTGLRVALIRHDWEAAARAYEGLEHATRIQWLFLAAMKVAAMKLSYDVIMGLDAYEYLIK